MNRIEEYVQGLDFDRFLTDHKTTDAVIRNIEVIGEAAGNVPLEICDRHPEIPWRRMIRLRNITIHEYFGVDLSIIWRIATKDLPETKPLIADLMNSIETGPN
jgi:uncharacterized protein with HEPN domain